MRDERDLIRGELDSANAFLGEERRLRQMLGADLKKSKEETAAMTSNASACRDQLELAWSLSGWKQQAKDVLQRDDELKTQLTSARAKAQEFEAKMTLLQARAASLLPSPILVAYVTLVASVTPRARTCGLVLHRAVSRAGRPPSEEAST